MNAFKYRRLFTLCCVACAAITTSVAQDHIIFRNGIESDVKLYQINDEKVVYSYIGDKTNSLHEAPSNTLYMVYINKQGNVYITPDGKRITGETKRADVKHKDVIYLVKGAEIAVDGVQITETHIRYTVKNKSKGIKLGLIGNGLIRNGGSSEALLEKSEVFMIRYKSGMVDIITPIENMAENTADTITTENKQPQYVVVFHAVAKGENLNGIASKYNVTPEQIAEWNDLPARIKPTTVLTTGMQLMIYQPK